MEQHVRFTNHGQTLLGVLFTPDGHNRRDTGLVFLHGWAGYRIGPHQMFTKMARRARAMGFSCFCFDFRGRGDSEGDAETASLSTMITDTQAAARTFREKSGVKRVVLVGVCSGGEVALGAGSTIAEVDSMVLWSVPMVAADRSHSDRAKRSAILWTYVQKLFRRETWAKLFSGALNFSMIKKAVVSGGKGDGEESTDEDKEIDWRRRFIEFRGEMLYIYGSNDPTTPDCIAHYERLSKSAGRAFVHHVIEGANHSFYSLRWEDDVLGTSLEWLDEQYPAAREAESHHGAVPSPA